MVELVGKGNGAPVLLVIMDEFTGGPNADEGIGALVQIRDVVL